MTHKIRLCGGPLQGQSIVVTELSPEWNWPVLDISYHRTGIIVGNTGEHLYACSDVMAELVLLSSERIVRDTDVMRLGFYHPRVPSYWMGDEGPTATRGENDPRLDEPVNLEVRPESISEGVCMPWSMRGNPLIDSIPKAAEWTKNNRHDIVDKIDEVIDAD